MPNCIHVRGLTTKKNELQCYKLGNSQVIKLGNGIYTCLRFCNFIPGCSLIDSAVMQRIYLFLRFYWNGKKNNWHSFANKNA